ncbi:hypothetical protein Q4519_07530 [Motilimonas sp. 1_MG-2023]|uniref:hypothetical protein n=1 Tax=Motilimonas sp. 1_MG-2023 TaxID=3062672 RepID=UPI0026E383E4|nr:hypothetical protein [Motilimonas sp. 1_MG-2023]MDO6525533.1 hypothetical protein [Motilimonas sp. 1_MG-2023]
MWTEILTIAEPVALLFGVVLVLIGYITYSRRKSDYFAPVKIFFNQVDDLTIAEYKFIRSGVVFLLLAVIFRFISLTFFP